MYSCRKLLFVRGFISVINKPKVQKNTEILKFQNFHICPNILCVDVDVHADTGDIAIALLHWSAVTLKKIHLFLL